MDGACRARERAPGGTRRAARAKACSIAASRSTSRPGSPNAATVTTTRPCRPMWSGSSTVTWNAASWPMACPGAVRAVRPRLPDCVLLQGARRMPRMQRAAHGRDGSASHRSRLAGPAAAAMGPRGAEAAARFSGTRRGTGRCGSPVPSRLPSSSRPGFAAGRWRARHRRDNAPERAGHRLSRACHLPAAPMRRLRHGAHHAGETGYVAASQADGDAANGFSQGGAPEASSASTRRPRLEIAQRQQEEAG